MKVNFYARLRQIVGTKTVGFSLPEGTTVQQLIIEVVTHYPLTRQELLDENGELHPHAHVYINGRDTPFLEEAVETMLSSDDMVDIFPRGHF